MKFYFKPNTPTEFHDTIDIMDYFFLLEKDKWVFVDDLNDAKIVPISLWNFTEEPILSHRLHPEQIAMIWIIETASDAVNPEYCHRIVQNSEFLKQHKKTIFVHSNELDIQNPQYICHSIMFNRQKLYFTEYDETLCSNKQWTFFVPRSAFELTSIDKKFSNDNKIFLVPNRITTIENVILYSQTLKIKLQNFMTEINANMHYSNPKNGIFLEYNGWDKNSANNLDFTRGSFFAPISDYYYNTSYVSVGIETIVTHNEIFYPSEKYYNHFIKGNFPLIFSAAGVIEKLKKFYGFKFPDWIDYSYDSIDDSELRFEAFLSSIEKVSKLSLPELHTLYLRDKHILEHNRNVFFTHPYDSLYDKVKNSIQQLGW